MSMLVLEEPEVLTSEGEELVMLMEAIALMPIDFLEADPIDESELPDEKVWDNFTRIQQKLSGMNNKGEKRFVELT